jgi:uncharacterized membrane protein YjjP (DUF1212 family)
MADLHHLGNTWATASSATALNRSEGSRTTATFGTSAFKPNQASRSLLLVGFAWTCINFKAVFGGRMIVMAVLISLSLLARYVYSAPSLYRMNTL